MSNNIKITADEGYWFGLGAFETIWVYKNKAIFIDEHLDRLKNAVIYLNIVQEPIDQWIDKDKIISNLECEIIGNENEIEKYISENPMENGVLKLTVSKENITITSRQNTYTTEQYEKGFELEYSNIRRNETSPFTYMKTLSYSDCIWEKRKAKENGFDEPIFLNTKGEICEGTTTNIFFVSKDKIVTPPVSSGLLNGVLRQHIMKISNVEERIIRPENIIEFTEIFLTNSLLGVMPVKRFGEHTFNSRNITNKLIAEYYNNL